METLLTLEFNSADRVEFLNCLMVVGTANIYNHIVFVTIIIIGSINY